MKFQQIYIYLDSIVCISLRSYSISTQSALEVNWAVWEHTSPKYSSVPTCCPSMSKIHQLFVKLQTFEVFVIFADIEAHLANEPYLWIYFRSSTHILVLMVSLGNGEIVRDKPSLLSRTLVVSRLNCVEELRPVVQNKINHNSMKLLYIFIKIHKLILEKALARWGQREPVMGLLQFESRPKSFFSHQ